MINNLLSSGETLQVSISDTYIIKDNEVFINNHLYKKHDLEIYMFNNHELNEAEFVNVGIRLRDGLKTTPANARPFNDWIINGNNQTSLSQLVESINTYLYND